MYIVYLTAVYSLLNCCWEFLVCKSYLKLDEGYRTVWYARL